MAENVIRTTDDFSLPFCQLKLQVLSNAESKENMGDGIVDVMFKAAVADTRAKGSNWIGLVRLMSPNSVQQVRENHMNPQSLVILTRLDSGAS